jgi:hypothetical protein
MAEQVLESLRKATESAIQAQQEMFRNWARYWTGLPASPAQVGEQTQAIQKKWAEALTKLFEKQREILEAQFNAGLQMVEGAFRVTEARDPEQFRARAIEYWEKSFESVRHLGEANLREFQAAVVQWSRLMSETPSAEKPA